MMDSYSDPADPVSQVMQENIELKARLEELSWDLRAIKASTTYMTALRLQKLASRFAAPRGWPSAVVRRLVGAVGPREPGAPSLSRSSVNTTAQNDLTSGGHEQSRILRPLVLDRIVPEKADSAPIHCFTTLTTSQLPKARVLAKTLKASNPGWLLHAVMPEPLNAAIRAEEEPFDSILTISDLEIENLKGWLFKHSVVEAANAVKGAGAIALFKRYGMDRLVYLDSDIGVFGDLSPIARLLDRHPVILTPHAMQPETDPWQVKIKELAFTRCGTFNLGFFALRADGQGADFLRWWWERLRDWCYIDLKDGLFVDQGWCDLAPAYFDKLHVLRDPRYNVASWNLTHRNMTVAEDGTPLVDGEPLAFFHFSGYDSGITAEAIRNSVLDGHHIALDLFDWYSHQVTNAGQEALRSVEWEYSRFANGRPIQQPMRIQYRSRPDLQSAFPDPFDTAQKDSFLAWCESQKV